MRRSGAILTFIPTLWESLGLSPKSGPRSLRGKVGKPASAKPAAAKPRPTRASVPPPGSMAERYLLIEREMLRTYGVRVRKWRTSMSGVAWQITYSDGTVSRLIESPRPRGPMSAAVFLHEIGHHAIGFDVYSPRCLEEYHAWKWSLERMEELGLNVTDAVRQRMHESLWYAVDKARRRGLKRVPAELLPYVEPPAPRRRRRRAPSARLH